MENSFARSDKSKIAEGESSSSLSAEFAFENKWTIAVDLTTNIRGADGKLNGAGAPEKWKQLQELAVSTLDKPVKVLVSVANQVLSEAPTERRAFENAPGANVLGPDLTGQVGGVRIDTYLIEKGKVKQLASAPSQGIAADLSSLLVTAETEAKSEHLGLFVFAHGTGKDYPGIAGDAGSVTLSELENSIHDGLAGRSKLDLLVFDACRMATTETANKMQSVSKAMVASEDQEIALLDRGSDGISLNAPLKDLLNNPQMSGQELAMEFINEAKKGANGIPSKTIWDDVHLRSSVDTLVALDLSKYTEFEDSLNELGSALDRSLILNSNKNEIAETIDNTATLPSRDPAFLSFQRDTQIFAQKILQSISSGKLIDSDGSIKSAAEAMLIKQKHMSLGYYGSSDYYQKMGGLTVELGPVSQASRFSLARARSVPGNLLYSLNDFKEFDSRNSLRASLEGNLAFLPWMQKYQDSSLPKILSAAVHAIESVKTPADYELARTQLKRDLIDYLDGPTGTVLTNEILKEYRHLPSKVSGKGWWKFLDDLNPQQ